MTDDQNDETIPAAPNPKRPLAWSLLSCAFCLAVAACILGSWLARWHWALDLLTSFHWQYLFGSIAAVICAGIGRSRKLVIVSLMLLIFNLSSVIVISPSVKPVSPLSAMTANVFFRNPDASRFIHYVRRVQPDFFVLTEFTPNWATQLEVLHEEYPHRLAEPRTNPFGIALYSKFPLEEAKLIDSHASGFPSISAIITRYETKVQILGTHPIPPVGRRNAAVRNAQLADLAELSRTSKHPVILLGDLNIAPWSPYFKDLCRNGNLINADTALLSPTWHRKNPFFCVPIDFALTSPRVDVYSHEIGPEIGSDHRPVTIRMNIPSPEELP
ncbi:endonuclease/exonuclease/phosphatase family protein [Planctomicrobium sp. SH661]|uniref:endonuclease/exonuclease/phosphatase family protein n=1 Tax=Planctomicrobium sp. SH661 TaxID=3448124 RepID=UPI003F5B6E04